MKKTILVTGGVGFIGTNLIEFLIKKYDIISIDNYTTGLKENEIDGVKYYNGDIRNISDYSIYGHFDVVFHLAAIARIQPSFSNPIDYFNTNANGTLLLCEYCSKNNIPLIYAGSSSHHSGKFKNPYTFSKDIGEEIIKLYQTHFNLNASISRFYNVYGPHHLKNGGYKTLLGTWEERIEKKLPLIIYGDGEKRRDFTHVYDIVDALIKIYETSSYGYIFEIGRGVNYSVNEIANMYDLEIIYEDDKPGEALTTLSNNILTKEILNWEPKYNIEDYIKKYMKKFA